MEESIQVVCENVPIYAIPIIANELSLYGASVTHLSDVHGEVYHQAGKAIYWLNEQQSKLHIRVVESRGDFSNKLLIGGIRQLVEETVERLNKKPKITN